MTKKKSSVPLVVKILLWLLALVAVLVVCALAFWNRTTSPVLSYSDTPNAEEISEPYKLRVPDDTTVRAVAQELEQNGIIRSANALYLAAYVADRWHINIFNRKREGFLLKSGVYTVTPSMPLSQVYGLLQSGSQEYTTVSIPEGLTMSKIAVILESSGICSAEDFLSSCKDQSILLKYGIPAENCEGYLFPDTYFFAPKTDSAVVVQRLIDTFYSRVEELDLPSETSALRLHEIVTLASIVEREYRVASEAPLIASVFTNRLKENIGLYSCATIEYIITEIQGKPHPDRITYDDLAIDSPYNTYKWAGLTPGPISNPGLTALYAAAHPAETNYYYFVLTDADAGSHTFSSTFDAHIAAENTSYVTKK